MIKKRILFLGLDILAAAVILLCVWIINYKLPQKGTKALPLQKITEVQKNVNMGNNASEGSLQRTDVVTAKEDLHKKFADKFTDKVMVSDTS